MISNLNNIVCFGEVLWDVIPEGPQPGGAPLNVAYHLAKLKNKVSIISRVGMDRKGEDLIKLITKQGIQKNFLQVDTYYATSQVLAKMNSGRDVAYDIVNPCAWDFITEDRKALEGINQAQYFVYGSLSARNIGTKETLYNLLENNTYKVFDINLRPPYFDKEVLGHLLQKADFAKLNEHELAAVVELFDCNYEQENAQVNFLRERFAINEVVITRGEAGASYYVGNAIYHYKGHPVDVKDTIGCGDAFLASFISSHLLQESPEAILRNAVAMGGFVATKKGGCPEYELEEFEEFCHNYVGSISAKLKY